MPNVMPLTYLDFPYEQHICLRSNNIQECVNEEIQRRAKAVQTFTSENLSRLIGAVCADMNDEWV